MTDRLQINVRIDQGIRDWLDNVPRSVSISAEIRSFLHSLMEKQGDNNGTTQ